MTKQKRQYSASRPALVQAAAELSKYANFKAYLAAQTHTRQQVYFMSRIARLMKWNVQVRNNSVLEDGKVIYIFPETINE